MAIKPNKRHGAARGRKNMVTITIFVSTDLHKALRIHADADRRSLSEMARMILEDRLKVNP
jgi:plasmid stability protein